MTKNKAMKEYARQQLDNKEWYTVRSIFGNTWANFFVLVGGRERGKSYSTMEYFLKDWKKHGKPFTWIRLKESAQKKLLQNNGDQFVDHDLVRRFDLELKVKGNTVFDHGKPMAKVLALSTFYNDKGQALFDNEYDLGYNICLDECNIERGERRTLDVAYAFVNQMENLVRSTKEKIRIVIIGNSTESCPDILCLFNFIPEQWGRFYIRSKKCVIDNIPNSTAYNARRKGTVADLLMPQASTFTNEIKEDKSKLWKGRLMKPTYIIKFDQDTMFTLWDGNIIVPYKKEHCPVIAMRPYLYEVFNPNTRDNIIAMYDAKGFYYKDLITMKKFTKELIQVKSRGS